MDLQKLIDSMNESQARTRGGYHLTYGELVKALKEAPADAVVDERFKGIGSWRGSYTEIAIFTEDEGLDTVDVAMDYDVMPDDWDKYQEEHSFGVSELPRNANELGKLLENQLGRYFTGWKGGEFEITEWKPIWITDTAGNSGNTAVIGIDDNMRLVTREVEY